MPRVFISHATGDQRFVDQHIVSFLQSHGIETWYSREDIHTASHWERAILEGLKSCDWFLVVISRRSIRSAWVNREVAWAEERRRGRVVPVLLDGSDPAELHLALVSIQHVDFRGEFDAARERLLRIWAEAGHPGDPIDAQTSMEDARLQEDLRRLRGTRLFRDAAEAGDAEAQYMLGVCQEMGHGTTPDAAEAVRWYGRAANQDHVVAQYHLGYCLLHGIGTDKDPDAGFRWALKAAKKGHAEAQNAVGWCLEKGVGAAQDVATGLSWYQEAANQDHAQAQYNIAYFYHMGSGVPQDLSMALKWYERAQAAGHGKADLRIREVQQASGLQLGWEPERDPFRGSVRGVAISGQPDLLRPAGWRPEPPTPPPFGALPSPVAPQPMPGTSPEANPPLPSPPPATSDAVPPAAERSWPTGRNILLLAGLGILLLNAVLLAVIALKGC